jgi:hypothetical protein
MIVAFIEFPLGASDRDRADQIFEQSISRYTDAPGLIRKYYLQSQDGVRGGGIYLFESEAAAERMYDDEWRTSFRTRWGQEPQIRYYRCPIVIDNHTHEVIAPSSGAAAIQNL